MGQTNITIRARQICRKKIDKKTGRRTFCKQSFSSRRIIMHSHTRLQIKRMFICFVFPLGIALLFLLAITDSFADTLPTLPQTLIQTPYAPSSGNTISVMSGDNLQTALNIAQLGDTIVLEAGATFTGPLTLPNKSSGSGWIYILSSNYSNLATPGTRVGIIDFSDMPKIAVSSGGRSAIETAAKAHHYRFVGIEFKPIANNFVHNLIRIGAADDSTATLPNNIVFDRCYIHGDPVVGGRRGVAMDGTHIGIIDSHFADFKEVGFDAQALCAYNTPGPLKIFNNFLEAAGENVVIGGADPHIINAVPSDIEISNNDFFKPLSFLEASWSVKNLLALKNARRVMVSRNRFENNWAVDPNGFSLLVTPRNQGGKAPWSATQDITINNNKFINLGNGISILGADDIHPSQRTYRILIKDNVINVTGLGGSSGRLFHILNGPADITIDHNTGFCTSEYVMSDNSTKAEQFMFQNNIVTNGKGGFRGTGSDDGKATLEKHYSTYVFTNNAIIGGISGNYPANNFFPADVVEVSFVNPTGGNYRLSDFSPYKKAGTNGRELGADVYTVAAPKGLVTIQ
jgi:hypothetical protein